MFPLECMYSEKRNTSQFFVIFSLTPPPPPHFLSITTLTVNNMRETWPIVTFCGTRYRVVWKAIELRWIKTIVLPFYRPCEHLEAKRKRHLHNPLLKLCVSVAVNCCIFDLFVNQYITNKFFVYTAENNCAISFSSTHNDFIYEFMIHPVLNLEHAIDRIWFFFFLFNVNGHTTHTWTRNEVFVHDCNFKHFMLSCMRYVFISSILHFWLHFECYFLFILQYNAYVFKQRVEDVRKVLWMSRNGVFLSISMVPHFPNLASFATRLEEKWWC